MRIAYSVGTTSFGSFPGVSLKLNGFSTAAFNDLIKNKTRNARSGTRMIARASLVPIAERFPFFAVFSRTKNVSFRRENEIRTHRQRELGETFFKQIDRAPSVDRPDRTSVLQFANQFHTLRVEHRFGRTRNKRPVKIDTKQPNW